MRCSMPAALLPILLGAISATSAGEVELNRVKSEWPAAARRLDEAFVQVRGSARLWTEKPHALGKSLLTDARFAIDHGMEKVEIERFTSGSKPTKLADIVYCVGEGTAFGLHRRAGAESYNVKGAGTSLEERYLYTSVFGRFVLAHHGAVGRPMSSFFEDSDFEIIDAEAVNQDGKGWIKVDCAFGSTAPKSRLSLVLDPENGWIVQSCRYQPNYDLDRPFLYEIEYGPAHAGIPLPRYVKITDEVGGIVDHCEFTGWEFASTPISEFNMTHYGLPDLVHAQKPRNMLAYWLAGFAVLAGVSAFALRWMASRRTAT